jgi:valine--pyruvate aminotransferase
MMVKILVNGNYKPLENGQNFSLKAEVKSIDMKKLLAGISSENLITGKMNAKVNLNSRINGKDSFAKYINVNSSFTIKKGELLGYANFIRPVAEIGKFINFTHSNDGKSTAFHSINGNISYKNKIRRNFYFLSCLYLIWANCSCKFYFFSSKYSHTMFSYSDFNNKLSKGSGIGELMLDLGNGLEQAHRQKIEISMLGGGNPAHIPSMEEIFKAKWNELGNDPILLARMLGDYSAPQGLKEFREILAIYLSKQLNAKLTPEHIAITQGSQSAFFMLLNSFSGELESNKTFQKILFPIVPEYIGYLDQSIKRNSFTSIIPIVEKTAKHRFVYKINFDLVKDRISKRDIGAICLSRPTNPSGNIVPSSDMVELYNIAYSSKIPLIVDNAYGYPFPNIAFVSAQLEWKPGMIQVFSLSKLGLPGLRTGIIVADPEVASRIGEMSSILNLAPGNVGSYFVENWLNNGQISQFSNEIIQPFYKEKSNFALSLLDECLNEKVEYQIHESHGALFLWLHFPNHKLNSRQIYNKLKSQGVFVVAGENFFPGLEVDFSHKNECIRLTYSRSPEEVNRGIKILASVLAS